MAGSSIKDKTWEKLDGLMKSFEAPPESFTIQDIAKRYNVNRHKAYGILRKLLENGSITRVSTHDYVISPERPADGTGPELRTGRQRGRKGRGAR